MNEKIQPRFEGSDHPYHPTPELATGALVIDPEIVLKAKVLGLEVEFFYNSSSNLNAEFGLGRSASVKNYIVSGTNGVARIERGDFSFNQFELNGSIYEPSELGESSTLDFDGTVFTEEFADGTQYKYQAVSGQPTTQLYVSNVVHPSGNRSTFAYGSSAEAGLLRSIEVPGGRRLTFTYEASTPTSLLSSVEDWAGRLWTFQYDASRSLTTYVSPLGCQTKTGYANGPTGKRLVEFIEDPRGFRTSYVYHSNDKVAEVQAGSAVWTYVYGTESSDGRTVVISPTGARNTFIYESGTGNLVREIRPEGYTRTLIFTPKETASSPRKSFHSALSAHSSSRPSIGNRWPAPIHLAI